MTGPESPPPDEPDAFTRKEGKKARKDAGKPSPTERLDASNSRHIEDLCDERARLIAENRGLRQSEMRLYVELSKLTARHAALNGAFQGILASNIGSVVMVGIGGAAISGAGYIGNDILKLSVLFAGIGIFLSGTAFQITATWRNALFRDEPPDPPVLQDSRSASGGDQLPPPVPDSR